ncbi:winged helix-turn-helix domain-containing protein [Enterococcus plantarum]|uniref:winged helix-turn-helix domain-containing protein n=1 Tax=Enterococcus plantarum TaxID=1077675 RepID=UPI001A8F96A6|nr:winged helix-turn-helix domain-containing protein [Enterococcus plantarum]MBO0423560.1 winged helix-turn-helix transcriptional regulator [Enterococcus plantarum]
MQTIIGIRMFNENQYGYDLGERLEAKGYKVNYVFAEEKNEDNDALVLVIDKTFNFLDACAYLLKIKNNKRKLIWVLSENQENEKEKNMLYHLGVCNYIKQKVEQDEEVCSIVNTMSAVKVTKDVLLIDENKLEIILKDKEKELTSTEYELFSKLFLNANEVVSYTEAAILLWGEVHNDQQCTARIANLVHSLRFKLRFDSRIIIKTIRKKGYMIVFSS